MSLIAVVSPFCAFGDEVYACGKWKREHPEISAINSRTQKLYPNEDGKPFPIIFKTDGFEILDRYEKKQILSFVGQLTHSTSIYKSSETGSAGFSQFYFLYRFDEKIIELERISRDLKSIYGTYCYK